MEGSGGGSMSPARVKEEPPGTVMGHGREMDKTEFIEVPNIPTETMEVVVKQEPPEVDAVFIKVETEIEQQAPHVKKEPADVSASESVPPTPTTDGSKKAQKKKLSRRKRRVSASETSCDICSKKFKYLSRLKDHMRIHTGEKPYDCAKCHKQFKRMSHLKSHSIIHTGEKPYSCKTCKIKFARLPSLEQHERVHTGEKPYSCKICGKNFRHAITLKLHIRSHTGEKPYQCKTCKKCFPGADNLKKHERRIHTGKAILV